MVSERKERKKSGAKAIVRRRCQGLTKWIIPRERRRFANVKLSAPGRGESHLVEGGEVVIDDLSKLYEDIERHVLTGPET